MSKDFKYEIKPVVGYEGLYSVSSAGEVFSHNYLRTGKTKKMKPSKDKDGYLRVGLRQDGKVKRYRVHRLVLQTFKPNPDNKLEVDHIDTDRTNNHVSNLRWCTHKENDNNPITRRNKSKTHKDKTIYTFKNKDTGEVFTNTRYGFYTKFNLSSGKVSDLVHGKRKSVKGWVLVHVMF